MSYDLVIRNGLVIDGTGSPGFKADVVVEGERISGIPKNLGLGQKEDGVRAIVFMLEEAVWKVTGLPGSKLKLHRGNLEVGWPADITVFDPDKSFARRSHPSGKA